MEKPTLDHLKLELSLQAKNGIDFMIAASIVWLVIAYIWTLPNTAYDKSILTFIIGSLMLPLAFGLSKVLKTNWKIKDNPLNPLGLWLNFAQLFYFPFLFFILSTNPDYFAMTYVIITGAHLFPYAWYYNEIGYAVMAGVISLGALLIAWQVAPENIYWVPVFMSACLGVLALWLFQSYKSKLAKIQIAHV